MSGEVTPRLTLRRLEVLAALARYGTYDRVAAELGITPFTVRSLLHESYGVLGVGNAIDAFRALGWLRPPA